MFVEREGLSRCWLALRPLDSEQQGRDSMLDLKLPLLLACRVCSSPPRSFRLTQRCSLSCSLLASPSRPARATHLQYDILDLRLIHTFALALGSSLLLPLLSDASQQILPQPREDGEQLLFSVECEWWNVIC